MNQVSTLHLYTIVNWYSSTYLNLFLVRVWSPEWIYLYRVPLDATFSTVLYSSSAFNNVRLMDPGKAIPVMEKKGGNWGTIIHTKGSRAVGNHLSPYNDGENKPSTADWRPPYPAHEGLRKEACKRTSDTPMSPNKHSVADAHIKYIHTLLSKRIVP